MRSIVETLLEVLTTPSQAVQRAVSGCLPPLMTGLSTDADYVAGLVARLLAMLQSPSYGDRSPCCHAPPHECRSCILGGRTAPPLCWRCLGSEDCGRSLLVQTFISC